LMQLEAHQTLRAGAWGASPPMTLLPGEGSRCFLPIIFSRARKYSAFIHGQGCKIYAQFEFQGEVAI